MNFDKVLSVVECAIGRDGHLLDTALALSCGHFVCKKCVPATNNNQFKCIKCNETNQTNLSLSKESEMVKFYIENN